MTKKPGYTVEQHFELGMILARMRDTMTKEYVKIASAYPINDKAILSFDKTIKTFDNARSLLDSTICRENPTADNSILRAYYPDVQSRRAQS
jgi:hypothetical protein